MDVVLIFNGLGNQMSQYAFYLAKKQVDARTRCLYFPDAWTCQHNGYELDYLFGIRPDAWENGLLGWILKLYLWSQVCDSRKRHWLRVLMQWLHITLVHEPSYQSCPDMFLSQKRGIRFLYGGWHCENNFKAIQSQLPALYRMNDGVLSESAQDVLAQINATNSISLHVRRGDFLTDGFGGICTVDYYQKAIAYMQERVDNTHFFVFSDDMEWVKANIQASNMHYVDIHHGLDSWKDMLLISRCKHNINANSTFSWWGAWLNGHKDKIVIVPNRFSQRPESNAIYPQSWIQIES